MNANARSFRLECNFFRGHGSADRLNRVLDVTSISVVGPKSNSYHAAMTIYVCVSSHRSIAAKLMRLFSYASLGTCARAALRSFNGRRPGALCLRVGGRAYEYVHPRGSYFAESCRTNLVRDTIRAFVTRGEEKCVCVCVWGEIQYTYKGGFFFFN